MPLSWFESQVWMSSEQLLSKIRIYREHKAVREKSSEQFQDGTGFPSQCEESVEGVLLIDEYKIRRRTSHPTSGFRYDLFLFLSLNLSCRCYSLSCGWAGLEADWARELRIWVYCGQVWVPLLCNLWPNLALHIVSFACACSVKVF